MSDLHLLHPTQEEFFDAFTTPDGYVGFVHALAVPGQRVCPICIYYIPEEFFDAFTTPDGYVVGFVHALAVPVQRVCRGCIYYIPGQEEFFDAFTTPDGYVPEVLHVVVRRNQSFLLQVDWRMKDWWIRSMVDQVGLGGLEKLQVDQVLVDLN